MLKQKLFLGYSSKIVMQFAHILATIVVARIAGPSVLGTVSFGLNFAGMFVFAADLGFSSAHIKSISEGRDLGDCIATFARIRIITTGFYFCITLASFWILKNLFNVSFESSTHETIIIILLLMNVVNSILAIPNRTFAARTEQAKQDIPEIIRSLVLQILRVTVVLLGYKALALAFCNLTSFIIIIPIVWYLFKDYPYGKFDRDLLKYYWKIALPMIVYGISVTLATTFDKVILQFLTNSEQVGYYSVGYRIGGFILLISNSIGWIFFPLFSKAIAIGDYDFITKKIYKFSRFSFLFVMPIVVFLAIYSDSLVLFILGEKYILSIVPFSIIVIAMFILVVNTPYGNVITGRGLFKLTAQIHVVNVILFVLTLILFIHPGILNLKAVGAALSILVSKIFLGTVFRIFSKREVKTLNIFSDMKYIIFGIFNFVFFYLIYSYFKSLWGTPFRLLFPFVFFIVTFLSMILLKWIHKEDWKTLLSIINVTSMKKYIKSEIIANNKID